MRKLFIDQYETDYPTLGLKSSLIRQENVMSRVKTEKKKIIFIY